MISVILYGELGKKYGKYHKYSVNSAPEAIRALSANFKEFRSDIKESAYYKIVVDKKIVDGDTVNKVAANEIKIIPVVQGASDGLGQAILGIVLIAVSWWNPYGWGALVGNLVGSIGSSLVLGGVGQMLAKTPSGPGAADRADNKPSYMFDGPINTSAQGNPVPLAYGTLLCGSQVISAGLEVR